MLDTLDDSVFASLEDAYGPAVDVPRRLRSIASGSLDEARAAIWDLAGGIFHQGTYYPAAAPTVPFLIELAGAELPARADVLLFLADMSGGPPSPLPFDPYVFSSTPGPPEYPEATATLRAIELGRDGYVAALGARDPRVRRAAAYLLACSSAPATLFERALEDEPDELTRVTLRFAIARAGGTPAAARSELESDVAVLLRGELDEAAFARLLDAPRRAQDELPFEGGDLVGLAARVLAEKGAFDVLASALATRLARGESIHSPPAPSSRRVSDDEPPRRPFAAPFDDAPLRHLASAMAHAAFGERAQRPPLLRREELDERRRRVLALTVEHGIPLPIRAAPWITPESMRRFLEGGGALDREVTASGVVAPAYTHLHAIARRPNTPEAIATIDAVVAALATSEDEAFAAALDLLDAPYGLPSSGHFARHVSSAIAAHVLPKTGASGPRFEAYARALAGRESVTPAQAVFALRSAIDARTPPPEELDRVVRAALPALFEGDVALAWLSTFEEPRRSRIVAAFGNAYLLDRLRAACDEAALARATLEGFLDPACAWMDDDAERVLDVVPIEELERVRAAVSGKRARILRRALRARTGEGSFTLELSAGAASVRAVLTDWTGARRFEGVLSAQPTAQDLEPIVRAVSDVEEPRIVLAGDLDPTTRYRVQRVFGDAGLRGEVADGSTTMRTGLA